MPIEWKPEFATGVRDIDLQHRELIELINDLERATLAGATERVLGEVLPRLAGYALFHFATEEHLIPVTAQAVAHAERHAREHREFTRTVERLTARFDGMPATPADLLELRVYLERWLLEHILGTDRELAGLLS